MKMRLLLAIFVFFSALPVLASACTTHDQCSQACNSLGYGSCPYGVYGCMVRDCCIGQCNYWETNECFCLHTTRVSIYGSVCPTGSFCGSDCNCHPTQPVPVCNAGDTRNRHCACSTQVSYEICDGSGWNPVMENCPSGTVCSSGYCVPVQTCSQMYLNNYLCSGNWVKRQYQYQDCSTTWVSLEKCYAGCSEARCLPEAATTTTTTTLPQKVFRPIGWTIAVWKVKLAFTILLLPFAVLVLLLLLRRECICCRRGPRRNNRPECFES